MVEITTLQPGTRLINAAGLVVTLEAVDNTRSTLRQRHKVKYGPVAYYVNGVGHCMTNTFFDIIRKA